MICTSNYNNMNINGFKNVSISGDRGKNASYVGDCFPSLAPKKDFWQAWHQNIDKVPSDENNRFYIDEYYKQVLAHLDIEEVYKKLDGSLLLCYENYNDFCHRHIVAAWFELILDVKVNEIVKENDTYVTINRLKDIKEYLNEIMVKHQKMGNFTSLHALYMYQKGDAMVEEGKKLKRDACSYDFYYCRKYERK